MPELSEIELSGIDGSSTNFKLPSDDYDDGPAMFDKLALAIQREWDVRRAIQPKQRAESAIPWLTLVAYKTLGSILDHELTDLFKARIEKFGRYPRGQRADLNSFQLGIMALFAHDLKAISRQTRERVGKELWYAYRHYVPPEFLLGFLKQVRSPDLAKRAVDEDIEPGFESWVIERRRRNHDKEGESRGWYPPAIENEVERRQRKKKRRKR